MGNKSSAKSQSPWGTGLALIAIAVFAYLLFILIRPPASLEKRLQNLLGDRLTSLDTSGGIITLSYTIAGGFSENMVRSGARIEVERILETIAKYGGDYGSVTLVGSFPMAGPDGVQADTPVVKLSYERATIENQDLDWNEIYEIADTRNIHPDFQDR